tara:strand:+ start:970 stop:1674 length:705 start_codon:yes stop_codon:yes gene_type:complete
MLSSNRKIVGIIQARMGSSRLPKKMMLDLHGKPIIQWVVERSMKSKLIDKFIVAIPDNDDNNLLHNFLQKLDVNIFRGSENNVVDRFFNAAKIHNATDVVRICADRPLICSGEIDRLVNFFQNGDYDYAYNHIPINNQYPIGFGAEISTMRIIKKINDEAQDPLDLEHLYNYILGLEKGIIKIGTFDPVDINLCRPELKFDLDTLDDYNNLCSIKYNIQMTAEKIVAMRDQHYI